MVLTPSTMLPLDTPMPEFELLDTVSSNIIRSQNLDGELYLVCFMCNHCPYVVHILKPLVKVCNELIKRHISVMAVSSNDPVSYPQDGPEKMALLAQQEGFGFPYCFDESQEIARAFNAACTPEFYLFNKNRKLIYRGQFDSSRPGSNVPVTGEDLVDAVELGLRGEVKADQVPSVGCNIKWKS